MFRVSIESSGFEKSLRNFQNKIEEAAKPESVSLTVLMDPDFMVKNTDSVTFDDFLTKGGYSNDADAFLAIPDEEFDSHVRRHSRFNSWQEMQESAGGDYMRAKLKRIL